jgi:hypothetical protein
MPGRGETDNARTVLRAGWGLFYDRVTDALLLEIRRSSSGKRQEYEVSDPSLLNQFPALPALDVSGTFKKPRTPAEMARDLQPASVMQTMVSLERRVFGATTISITGTHGRTRHALRARLIGVPPYSFGQSLSQVESTGRVEERRLVVDINAQAGPRLNLMTTYTWNNAASDTDGPSTLLALLNDWRSEYGRAEKDMRQHFTMTGTIKAPHGWEASPFLVASSNRPFNIFVGRTISGDTLLPMRPAPATVASLPGVVQTPYGMFLLDPAAGQKVIPRNSGTGPAFFSLNLQLARVFNLSRAVESGNVAQPGQTKHHHQITIALQALNLLNHTNPGPPVGDLHSSQFARSTTLAEGFNFGGGTPALAKRRFEAQLRFQF